MALEPAVYSLLSENTRLNAIIAGKVFPVEVPQSTVLPAIAFNVEDTTRYSTFGADISLVSTLLRVSVYSLTVKQVNELVLLVKWVLGRYRGTANGIVVHDIIFDEEVSSYDDDYNGFLGELTYTVWYEE